MSNIPTRRFSVRLIVEKKAGVFDPEAKVVERALLNLGHKIQSPNLKKVIEFTLEAEDEIHARSEIDQMCRQLLVNPVLENYHLESLK